MSTNALARPQSRRDLITALAAGTAATTVALGTQAAVAFAHEPDPIFALIEAEKLAHDALEDAISATSQCEELLIAAGLNRRPRIQVGTLVILVDENGSPIPTEETSEKPVYAYSRAEVRQHYAASDRPLTVGTGFRRVRPETAVNERCEAALARFDEDEAAIGRARDLSGIQAAERHQEKADFAQRQAITAVFRTVPTTSAGLLAMVDLFEARDLILMDPPEEEAIAGLLAAVRSVVGRG